MTDESDFDVSGMLITADDHPDLESVVRRWLHRKPEMIEYIEVEDAETGEVYRVSGEVLRERYKASRRREVDIFGKV